MILKKVQNISKSTVPCDGLFCEACLPNLTVKATILTEFKLVKVAFSTFHLQGNFVAEKQSI